MICTDPEQRFNIEQIRASSWCVRQIISQPYPLTTEMFRYQRFHDPDTETGANERIEDQTDPEIVDQMIEMGFDADKVHRSLQVAPAHRVLRAGLF